MFNYTTVAGDIGFPIGNLCSSYSKSVTQYTTRSASNSYNDAYREDLSSLNQSAEIIYMLGINVTNLKH
jgi:hypothetical protein